MKNFKLNFKSWAILLIATVATTMFSFRPMPGGDHFEIQVSNKTLIEQRIYADKEVKSLDLSAYKGESVSVFYSECGKVGTNRSLSIRNGEKILKTWKFDDVAANTKRPTMACKVNDILDVAKANTGKLTLVYASQENTGQVLASIAGNDVKASLK
jgi:hypothetical protein